MNSVAIDEKTPPEVVVQNIADAEERHLVVNKLGGSLSQATELYVLYCKYTAMMMNWPRREWKHPGYLLLSKQRAELGDLLVQIKPPMFF